MGSLTIRNIPGAEGRGQALREAVGVLRAGGRLRIIDDGPDQYAALLRDAGCAEVTIGRLDWRTWCGIPGHVTLVAACNPCGSGQRQAQEPRPGTRPGAANCTARLDVASHAA